MYTQHTTQGLSNADKIERCRQWVPGGKFHNELGSLYNPNIHTEWWYWCNRKLRPAEIYQLKAVP